MSDSIHDDSDPLMASRLPLSYSPDAGILKVYQTGPLTVVGFGGEDVPDEVCIAAYRDQLMELLDTHHCQTLAFDLTGVKLIPSGMLGVLISLRKRVERLELYNASEDIRAVLKLTNLLPLFELRDVQL